MNEIKLSDILCSGDMGKRGAERIEEENKSVAGFDFNSDVVSGVIVQAYNKNIKHKAIPYIEDFFSDIDYAISQLKLAKEFVKKNSGEN